MRGREGFGILSSSAGFDVFMEMKCSFSLCQRKVLEVSRECFTRRTLALDGSMLFCVMRRHILRSSIERWPSIV